MKSPLRILLCCQQDLQAHPVPAYRFWAHYFRAALAEAGHTCLEVPDCDWAAGLESQPPDIHALWLESTWQKALRWIRQEHARGRIDVFLSYLFPDQVDVPSIAALRQEGMPCVNFFCDNVRLFRRIPAEYGAFDLNWVPEAPALALYRRAGFPVIHAPMPCWVPPACRTPGATETLPATFVGTRDEQRERLFARAFACGLDMELRGPGWLGPAPGASPPRGRGPALARNQWEFARRHGLAAFARKLREGIRPRPPVTFDFAPFERPAVWGDDYLRVLRESRVCVGVNRFPSLAHPFDRPGRYSRLRDIEAPMAGACYLTEWAPGLEEFYEPGSEIEVYRDAEELCEKVAKLNRDEPLRRRLRAAGQRRALGDHAIARTVEKIAGRLSL